VKYQKNPKNKRRYANIDNNKTLYIRSTPPHTPLPHHTPHHTSPHSSINPH
jgi:hypothetical protein